MSNEKLIAILEKSDCLVGTEWFSSVLCTEEGKFESLFIYDKSFPESELAENLLDMAEDILGKERFHDLLVACL